MLVQHIFPPLLIAPPTVRLNGTDGTHDMKMRIRNAAVLLVQLMHGKVHYHATAHEIVQ